LIESTSWLWWHPVAGSLRHSFTDRGSDRCRNDHRIGQQRGVVADRLRIHDFRPWIALGAVSGRFYLAGQASREAVSQSCFEQHLWRALDPRTLRNVPESGWRLHDRKSRALPLCLLRDGLSLGGRSPAGHEDKRQNLVAPACSRVSIRRTRRYGVIADVANRPHPSRRPMRPSSVTRRRPPVAVALSFNHPPKDSVRFRRIKRSHSRADGEIPQRPGWERWSIS
jgi:hypothetical protein